MKDYRDALAQLPKELIEAIDLPRVSREDIEAAAARIATALRRIRAESVPDQPWDGSEAP
jgi:hypothetical protein